MATTEKRTSSPSFAERDAGSLVTTGAVFTIRVAGTLVTALTSLDTTTS